MTLCCVTHAVGSATSVCECVPHAGRVIKGWDLGVATMKKGEKAVLTCRADYAYGESGSPPKIPPGATLNFEVRASLGAVGAVGGAALCQGHLPRTQAAGAAEQYWR